MCISKFTIAVDRKFKKDGEPTADFINCVSFGKIAEFGEKRIRIIAHIRTRVHSKHHLRFRQIQRDSCKFRMELMKNYLSRDRR